MKRIRSCQILVLVLLIIALLLTGCGKKKTPSANTPPITIDPFDPEAPQIHFVMPDTFEDAMTDEKLEIPAGKFVRFYTLPENIDDEDDEVIYDADYTFTQMTMAGGGRITCNIPDFLLGQERYIFAIVVLQGNFDLKGKTVGEVKQAFLANKILYGTISDNNGEYKPFTLNDGATIGGFDFRGFTGDPSTIDPEEPEDPEDIITVTFELPSKYSSSDDEPPSHNMPNDKPIDFYLTEIEGDEDSPLDIDAVRIEAHIPPSRRSVTCKLPGKLEGIEWKIHALVHLQPTDLDLRGRTFSDIQPELGKGTILYGTSNGKQLIEDGTTIHADQFSFYGVPIP